jgi:hypothetical protein
MADSPIRLQLGDRVLDAVLGKRGGARWAIGRADGPRSSTWRLWGNKKGDIYLSARSLGSTVKTSLHADGKCQSGLTQPFFERLRTMGRAPMSRHLDLWRIPESGLTKAIQIAVPHSELSEFASKEDPQTAWLPPPGPSQASVVTLFVGPKEEEHTSWPGEAHGSALVAVAIAGRRLAWLVVKNHYIGPDMATELDRYRRQVEGMHRPVGPSGTRAIVFGSRPNGERFYVEFGWDGTREHNAA